MSAAPFTVYGMAGATCTQRILLAAVENNAEWKLELVDLSKGQHKTAEHLARQPFGQIPAIKDGDLSFYESRAITRYVNETRGGKLTPATVGERALMEQWISLEQGTINPDVSVIVYQRVFAPMYGGKPDEAVVKLHAEKIVKALDIMSAHLEKNQYLAGASFSLADLFYMPYFQLLTVTPEANLISSRPALAAWWKRISERASWQKVLSLSEFAQKK